MEVRKAALDELNEIMAIYDNARRYMSENGNPAQWINGYPGIELVKGNIIDGKSYVCVEDNRIVGVFYFDIGPDPTYATVYEGEWMNDSPYGVVHRIASASHKKGVASYCLNWCFDKCPNIRIDTHKDNIIMQNLLSKNGFLKCGIIYLENGAERIAYQKVV